MRVSFALASILTLLSMDAAPPSVERIAANDNRVAAGVLKNGILAIRLEAREGEWHRWRIAARNPRARIR